jgi:hypothetical protein
MPLLIFRTKINSLYIQFDDIGVTHQEVEEKKFFAWSEIESVWFARIRSLICHRKASYHTYHPLTG